jgi:RNA polymerase sigma factor (TIGR02999 family)
MDPAPGEITVLLRQWRDGNREAESELFRLVLPDLNRLAHYFMNRERRGHTLASGDLVNQMFFKLVSAKHRDWENRREFFRMAARAMRFYLIDYFRTRPRAQILPLEEVQNIVRLNVLDLDQTLAIDRLLDEMQQVHPELCTIVELKCFLNLTSQEAADALNLSLRSFERKWHDARVWMFERLEGSHVRN